MKNKPFGQKEYCLKAAVAKFQPTTAQEIELLAAAIADIEAQFDLGVYETPSEFHRETDAVGMDGYWSLPEKQAKFLVTKYFEWELWDAIHDESYQLGVLPEQTQKWVEKRREKSSSKPANYYEAEVFKAREIAGEMRDLRVVVFVANNTAYEVIVKLNRYQQKIAATAGWQPIGESDKFALISQLEEQLFTHEAFPDIHFRLLSEWGKVHDYLRFEGKHIFHYDKDHSAEENFARARKAIHDYVGIVVEYVSVITKKPTYEHCIDHAIQTWPCKQTAYDRKPS